MRNLLDESTGTQFTADEYNSLKRDIIRTALSAGITIDPANGPDSSDGHLSQAIAAYAQNSSFYSDGGTTNNYVLTKGVTNFKEPEAYTEGQIVWFLPLNANSGATTVKVGTLPVKNVTDTAGSALASNTLKATQYAGLVYRKTADRFEVLVSGSTGGSSGSNITLTTISASNQATVSTADTTDGRSREWFVGMKESSGVQQKNFTVTARDYITGIDWTVYGITGDKMNTSVSITKASGILSLVLTNNHTTSLDIDARLVT